MPPRISIIVAIANNGTIGNRGSLPWHLSSDLRRFKKTTVGHSIVMGRNTFESIGRPLPQRQNIVVTSHPERVSANVLVAKGLPEAISIAAHDELFVIGGARLYQDAMGLADRLLVTRVLADVEGDTHFPWEWIQPNVWELVEEESPPQTENDSLPFCYQTFHRRQC